MAMPRSVIRMICMLLVIALPVFLPADAFASKSYREAYGTEVYVNNYSIKVYETPSTKSDVLAYVPFAKNIKRIAVKKGWAKVYTVNRCLGYCLNSQLTINNPNKLNTSVYCQAGKTPVYRMPDFNSSILGHLYRNDKVRLVAMTPLGDWMRVEQNGYYGYIPSPYMDYKRYTKGSSSWCKEHSVDIFYDSGMKTRFGTLYFGESLTLISRNGSVAKVRSNGGLIGYCNYASLTKVNPNNLKIPVYTQVEGNFLFKASFDLRGRLQVDKDEEMVLLAVDNNKYWARVRYEGDYYYVPYVFLDTQRRAEGYKKVSTRTGAHIREGTKKSSGIVATVPTGAELWLIGATDNWAKVATMKNSSGKYYMGFIELQYLK